MQRMCFEIKLDSGHLYRLRYATQLKVNVGSRCIHLCVRIKISANYKQNSCKPFMNRSITDSYLTSWCNQSLSRRALNRSTESTSTTEFGKLFQMFTMHAEKQYFRSTLLLLAVLVDHRLVTDRRTHDDGK